MTYRCPYCDQTLLEDETVCWQCGRPVEKPPATPAGAAPTAKDGWQKQAPNFAYSALVVYTTLTVLIVGGVLLSTIYLGRQPRLQAGANTELPEGWRWVNENSKDFLLFLPETWQVRDPQNEAGEIELERLLATLPGGSQASQPFGQIADDLAFIFLAQGQVPPQSGEGANALVLVARSRLLNQLALAEMVAVAPDLARESGSRLLEVERVAPLPGIEVGHVSLVVEGETARAETLRCRQELIPGKLYALLVAACTRPEAQYQTPLNMIMESFQRLAP